MYLPTHFEIRDRDALYAFMQAHPLATLIVADASGLSADHVPLLLVGNDDSGWRLQGHVARANLLWKKAETGIDCLVIFHGPQHYISPNLYATKKKHGKVVPTWNYEVVHVQGHLRAVQDLMWLGAFLERLTEAHEANQSMPWKMSDAPNDYIERMLQGVVGIEVAISSMSGKAKLSQNQPIENQASLVAGLRMSDETQAIMMARAIETIK